MLQHDEYGFIIGEKRLKELNGNIANIDATTQDILEILAQSQKIKATAGKRELSYLEQLILLSNEKNKSPILIDITNQNRENLLQNHPISATFVPNEYRLTAHRVLATPRFSNASEYGAINRHQDNHQGGHQSLPQDGIWLTNNTPKPQQRDANGRFVSIEQSRLDKAVDKLVTAVNMVNMDTTHISPEIDALHEVKETISPALHAFTMMGRGVGHLFKKPKETPLPKAQQKQNKKDNLHQKEERRLLRLILRHIGDTSWLAWLLPLLGKIGFDGLSDREGRNRRGRGRGQGLFGGIFGGSKDNKKSPKSGKKGKFKLPAWLKLPDLTKLSRLPNKLPTWLKGAGLLGLVLSATKLLDWQQMNVHERGEAIGSITGGLAGGWAGGVAGASLGATVGSVVPVVGTAVGGVIGGVLGALGGSWLGSDLGQVVGEKLAPHGESLINTVVTHGKDVSDKVSVIATALGLAMRDNAVQTYRYLSDVVAKAWQVIEDGLGKITDFMTALTTIGKTAFTMSLGVFGDMVNAAMSSLDSLYQTVKQFVGNKIDEFSDYFSQIFSGIGGFLSDKLSSWTGFVTGDGTGSNVVGGDVGSYTVNDGMVKMDGWSKRLKANQFDKLVPMLAQKAVENGIDPETLLAFANIESSFDPNAQNTNYGGLFQISKKDHQNWRNPEYNTNVTLKMMAENQRYYQKHFGKNAKWTAGLAYLYHQQGMGGATELLKNPNMSAAAALQRTKQWQNKSQDWIWKYVVQANGGRVGMSAKEFSDLWVKRADVLEDAYRKQGKYSKATQSTANKATTGAGVKTSNISYAQAKAQNSTLDNAIQSTKPQVGIGVKATNFVSVQPLVAEPSELSWTTVANTVLSTFGVQTDGVSFKRMPTMPNTTPKSSMGDVTANITPPKEQNTTVFMPTLSQEIGDEHLARLLSGGYLS